MGAFGRFLVERFDGKLTEQRLDRLETNLTQILSSIGALMASFSDFSSVLEALKADVAAVKVKSDASDSVVVENEALKTQIADLKAQLADAKANGGMTAAEEATLLANLSELEAQIHPAPVVETPAEPTV
jgi:uncharacterized protein involved in exopolysaccharide biosynthesis